MTAPVLVSACCSAGVRVDDRRQGFVCRLCGRLCVTDWRQGGRW